MMRRDIAIALTMLGCVGCGSKFTVLDDAQGSGGADAGDGRTLVATVPVTINRSVDILFVLDDSPGTLDKQTNLKNNFPNFVNVLNTTIGGLPDVHLGVVSTDVGTKGTQDATAGPGIGSGPGACSGNGKSGNLQTNGTSLVSGTFISDTKNTDGTRTTNYTGTLTNAFSAIASLGAAGCGFEQPLEAVRRALGNNPANAGFLRPNANLAVVFVTDEDDCSFSHSTLLGSDTATLGPLQSFRCTRFGVRCSGGGNTTDEMNMVGTKTNCQSNEGSPYLEPVETYSQFLAGLKADARMVFVGAIAGPATPVEVELRTPPGGGGAIPALAPSCSYIGGTGQPEVADPGVRLAQLVHAMPQQSLSSICRQDLSEALVVAARGIKWMIGDPCITENLPANPDCIVTQEVGLTTQMLPRCGDGTTPCWQIVSDPIQCTALPNQRLQIDRAETPPPNAVVTMRCRI